MPIHPNLPREHQDVLLAERRRIANLPKREPTCEELLRSTRRFDVFAVLCFLAAIACFAWVAS